MFIILNVDIKQHVKLPSDSFWVKCNTSFTYDFTTINALVFQRETLRKCVFSVVGIDVGSVAGLAVSCPGVCVAFRIAHHCEAALDIPGACAEDQRCCVPRDLFASEPTTPPEFVLLDKKATTSPEQAEPQQQPTESQRNERPEKEEKPHQSKPRPEKPADETLKDQEELVLSSSRPKSEAVSSAPSQRPEAEQATKTQQQPEEKPKPESAPGDGLKTPAAPPPPAPPRQPPPRPASPARLSGK